jgi:hypothetical protein
LKHNVFFLIWISFTIILISIYFVTTFLSDANFNYKLTATGITLIMMTFWIYVLKKYIHEQKELQSLESGSGKQ